MDELTRNCQIDVLPASSDASGDPAVTGLIQLIDSEYRRAARIAPGLMAKADGGRVWLLWFAIGATETVCDLAGRDTQEQRNAVFRQVVGAIFDGGAVRSDVDPAHADRRLIDMFQSAGADAVTACLRGDRHLGYYLEALRVSRRLDY
jgi:hypothetical protein